MIPFSCDLSTKEGVDALFKKAQEVFDEHIDLYFCNAGKDRTGVVSAILLTRLGYDREYIVADYMKSAENLRGTLEAFVKNRPDVDLNVITPQPAYMQDFLTWLHHNATK